MQFTTEIAESAEDMHGLPVQTRRRISLSMQNTRSRGNRSCRGAASSRPAVSDLQTVGRQCTSEMVTTSSPFHKLKDLN